MHSMLLINNFICSVNNHAGAYILIMLYNWPFKIIYIIFYSFSLCLYYLYFIYIYILSLYYFRKVCISGYRINVVLIKNNQIPYF